jgi:hypothetical protein
VPESRRWLDCPMRGRRTQAPELAHWWLQQRARAAADADGDGAHSREPAVGLGSIVGGLALKVLMKLGAAQNKAPAAWRLVTVEAAVGGASFGFWLNRKRARCAGERPAICRART